MAVGDFIDTLLLPLHSVISDWQKILGKDLDHLGRISQSVSIEILL